MTPETTPMRFSMKYIINQIMKNVMDSMIKITIKTLEEDMDIIQAVEEIKNTTDDVGLDMLKASLENIYDTLKSFVQKKIIIYNEVKIKENLLQASWCKMKLIKCAFSDIVISQYY